MYIYAVPWHKLPSAVDRSAACMQPLHLAKDRIAVRWIRRQSQPVASLGEDGGGGPPRVTPYRGVTPEGNFLWANLQRIVDKQDWTGKIGAGWHPVGGWHPSEINKNDNEEQKRSSVFREKINRGDTAELADGDD